VDPAVRGLPTAVARTRSHLLDAIRSGNDDGLLDEIGERRDVPFSYTFGDPVEGGAVAFWRRLKRNGHSDPFAILGRLLGGAPARRDSLYVWPDWFDRPLVAFNEAQKESLERLTSPGMYEKMRSNGFYIGPRTAIRADGLWMFYVSGD
jgi:hypothetical protein